MPAVTRVGDNNTGHDACPPTALSSGSPNVNINGIPAGRVGDSYTPHGCPAHVPHVGTIAAGASHVFINGKAVGRVGDPVTCGGSVAAGSPNVFIGNGGGSSLTVNGQAVSALDFKCNCVENVICSSPLLSKEDEIICKLPNIAATIAKKNRESEKDYTGWMYLSEQSKKWLCDDLEKANNPSAPFIVSLDWAREYSITEDFYNQLVSFCFVNEENEPKGVRELINSLKKANQWPDVNEPVKNFDHTVFDDNVAINESGTIIEIDNPWEYFDRLYFNSRSVPRYYELDTVLLNELNTHISMGDFGYMGFGKNGLLAGLGAFSLRCLAKGNVTYDGNNKYTINISSLAVYIADNYDFNDNKSYGAWSSEEQDVLMWVYALDKLEPMVFQLLKNIYNMGYYSLRDSLFREFRQKYKRGADFYIRSQPKVVTSWEQKVIKYDALSSQIQIE